MTQWIVARTKSKRERWAAENVVRQGCKFYLPQYEVPPKKYIKTRESRSAVLFPSYLFIGIEGQWKFLLGTFGIISVILDGDGPAKVPQSEIDKLVNREDDNGLIQLPDKFRLNQEVRIRSGIFEDKIGLWQGQTSSERQRVLLDFLGGKREFILAKELLEVA